MNLENKIKTAVQSCGVELYDIVTLKENGNTIFRVYITKKGGVGIKECAEVTKILSPLLDVDEPLSGDYVLEVSSPGIERKLKTLEHFKASVGEKAKVKLNSLEIIKGEISKVTDNIITIADECGEDFDINFDDILSASTYFDF